ncbi:MAG: hypothetical protein NXI32_29695, partial [bacterium]|nr:hypothetical protein [bacterium]
AVSPRSACYSLHEDSEFGQSPPALGGSALSVPQCLGVSSSLKLEAADERCNPCDCSTQSIASVQFSCRQFPLGKRDLLYVPPAGRFVALLMACGWSNAFQTLPNMLVDSLLVAAGRDRTR